MISEDSVVFGLAALGYLLLAKDAALRILGRRWGWVGGLGAVVIATHVLLVWALRFDWSFSRAWEKSASAFLIFHAAFGLILVAPLARPRVRDRVTWLAFGIVSVGALSATFRYPDLRLDHYAIPLWAAFAAVLVVFCGVRVGWLQGGDRPR